MVTQTACLCFPAALLALVCLLICSQVSFAARIHVRLGGHRTAGPSLPDDWSIENCYPTIALGLQNAAPADTLLLAQDEDHRMAEQLILVSFLGNQDLDAAYQTCRIVLDNPAQLTFNRAASRFTVRGVTFLGGVPHTFSPAFRIENNLARIERIDFEDCLFRNLHGWEFPLGGSCLLATSPGNDLQLSLERCRFNNNYSFLLGGALCIGDGYLVTLEQCEFIRMRCMPAYGTPPRGGAVAVYSPQTPSSLVMQQCRLDSNLCWGPGGALAVLDAHLTMRDCTITQNRSDHGGTSAWAAGAGIYVRHDKTHDTDITLEVEGCQIIGNKGNLAAGTDAADGGGLLALGSDTSHRVNVHVTETLFADNYNAQGAGLYLGRFATGLIERSRFLRNTAYLNGGASYKGGAFAENLGETGTYLYCEFIANQAGYDASGQPGPSGGRGGAFMTRLNPRADFVNCSFQDNRCGGVFEMGDAIYIWDEGGSYQDPLQRSTLVNCAFFGTAGNDIQIRAEPYGFRLVTHCAYPGSSYECEGVESVAAVILRENPFIAEADLHLVSGAACCDMGMDLGVFQDIEGIPVPQGVGTDIGAHETEAPVGRYLVEPLQATVRGTTVELRWRIAPAAAPATACRLIAQGERRTWQIAPLPEAAGWYTAHDTTPFLNLDRRVAYQLEAADSGGEWFALASTTIDLALPSRRAHLGSVFPNPFNPHTTISFELSHPDAIRLSVHDAAGHRIVTLTDGPWPAGRHRVLWHGRDQQGRAAAAGNYYIRLTTSDHSEARKLTLIR